MSDTRRDFLRLAAGSLAAVSLGTESAQACWCRSSRPRFQRPLIIVPRIGFQTPTDFSEIARSFTVYGTYEFDTIPQIDCMLTKSESSNVPGVVTHSATMGEGTWMADFTVPSCIPDGATGLTLTASIRNTAAHHHALNLKLFNSATPTPHPVTIDNPGSMVLRDKTGKQVKPKLKHHAKPTGTVNDRRITSVQVTYMFEGRPLHAPREIELKPEQGAKRTWKVKKVDEIEHIYLGDHPGKTKVACVVEALIESSPGVVTKRFLVSDHTNEIE